MTEIVLIVEITIMQQKELSSISFPAKKWFLGYLDTFMSNIRYIIILETQYSIKIYWRIKLFFDVKI